MKSGIHACAVLPRSRDGLAFHTHVADNLIDDPAPQLADLRIVAERAPCGDTFQQLNRHDFSLRCGLRCFRIRLAARSDKELHRTDRRFRSCCDRSSDVRDRREWGPSGVPEANEFVVRQTLYYTFRTKSDLLQATYEWAVRDDGPHPHESQWWQAVETADNVHDAVGHLVAGTVPILERAAPLVWVVRSDQDARATYDFNEKLRRDRTGVEPRCRCRRRLPGCRRGHHPGGADPLTRDPRHRAHRDLIARTGLPAGTCTNLADGSGFRSHQQGLCEVRAGFVIGRHIAATGVSHAAEMRCTSAPVQTLGDIEPEGDEQNAPDE